MKRRSIFIWILGLIAMPGLVIAGQVSWKTAADGDWSTATNWDTDTVPGSGDSVIIDLSGSYTVTLDINTSIAHLTIGTTTGVQTLSLDGGVLDLTENVSIASSGYLSLYNSTINADSVINQGTVALDYNGTLNAAVMNHGLLRALFRENRIQGTLNNGAGDTLRVAGSGSGATLQVDSTLTNAGVLELTNTDPGYSRVATLTMPGAGDTLINTGSIRVLIGTYGGSRYLNVNLDNRGTMQVEHFLYMLRPSGIHANASGPQMAFRVGSLSIPGGCGCQPVHIYRSLRLR